MNSIHHKIIYGCVLQRNDSIEPIYPFKKYNVPHYGEKAPLNFIGFEYDRIDNLCNKYKFLFQGCLTFVQGEVPRKIKDLFSTTYPNKKGHSYALIQNVYIQNVYIQNVYTDHYATGSILVGYPIITNENSNKIDLSNITENKETGFRIINTSSSQTIKLPFRYFYGKEIVKLETCESADTCRKLAKQLKQTYIFNPNKMPNREQYLKDLGLDSRFTLSDLPCICFVNVINNNIAQLHLSV